MVIDSSHQADLLCVIQRYVLTPHDVAWHGVVCCLASLLGWQKAAVMLQWLVTRIEDPGISAHWVIGYVTCAFQGLLQLHGETYFDLRI